MGYPELPIHASRTQHQRQPVELDGLPMSAPALPGLPLHNPGAPVGRDCIGFETCSAHPDPGCWLCTDCAPPPEFWR
jgi:hypothetical protein